MFGGGSAPVRQLDTNAGRTPEAVQALLMSDYGVSRETIERFVAYEAILAKWAPRINLVGASTLGSFWDRHILDSAQILPLARPEARTWVDFGSGAGFPGLVIAALLQSQDGAHVTLIEASTKRCGFLRETARAMQVQVDIVNDKLENVVPRTVDIITARAFTALDRLLTYAEPWQGPQTQALFPKGEEVSGELAQASTNWRFKSTIHPSVSDARGCIVEITECQARTGSTQS
ncbi:MAG: 16S rRNA (guanine(527)-N(7))-methyltransferase RsmG [Alphaproteobacteria bacterium PA3]|nr:MAG: 16S rRNA (guanine(527)-N(7))-methyltransferase RsmG [Alphaproteobacteria bacterium PA3]